jgi:protein-tyrosine phosphatase
MRTPEVLFICTGNYYRSRFAEAVFNHLARTRRSQWRAFSRGVAIHLAPPGLSPHTRAGLVARSISLDFTAPERVSLAAADLQRAFHRIALKESEHRPYIRQQFPDWENQIEYWHFHDIDFSAPDDVLPEIEMRVRALFDRVADKNLGPVLGSDLPRR